VCDNPARSYWKRLQYMKSILLMAAMLSVGLAAAAPEVLTLDGDLSPIHDPAMVREGDNYYAFATNKYQQKDVPMFCSPDLHHWKFCGNVFDGVPGWALEKIPGARGIWAPDIKFVRGEFRLYYSVSTFGSNQSVIGLITNKTLNPASADYKWMDQGLVFESTKQDDFNAIDPNLAVDAYGGMWMSFGSFWSGIKMRRLDPKTGKLSSDDTTLYSLASRPRTAELKAEIEAPFIVRNGTITICLYRSTAAAAGRRAATRSWWDGRTRSRVPTSTRAANR